MTELDQTAQPTTPMSFGKRLKKWRLDHFLTLREMRVLTGYRENTLWRIENEKVQPQELTMAKIRWTLRKFGDALEG